MGQQLYALGIDIGGTNSEFGVVDINGKIVLDKDGKELKRSIPTKNPSTKDDYNTAEEYVSVLVPELKKIIKDAGGKDLFKGIGIGAPNGNYYSGTIEFAPNLKWAREKEVHLVDMIEKGVGLPCSLTNDANAAAIGEMHYGIIKERGLKHFIMITLGTGVGSGIVINGYMLYGRDGFAGELGHVIVRPYNGRLCGCGRCGCLETYASAPGIARTAREMLESNWDEEKKKDGTKRERSLLRDITDRDITSEDVSIAAGKGDELSLEVYNITGRILGEALSNFVTFSSPQAVVLFGGPAKAGELIRKPIIETMNATMLKVFKLSENDKKKEDYKIIDPLEGTVCKTKVLFSQLPGGVAAILGASALVWEPKNK